MVLRGENFAFCASRRSTSAKTSSLTSAGTGISIHSSRGRAITPACANTTRPACREVRLRRGGSGAVWVLPKQARPA